MTLCADTPEPVIRSCFALGLPYMEYAVDRLCLLFAASIGVQVNLN